MDFAQIRPRSGGSPRSGEVSFVSLCRDSDTAAIALSEESEIQVKILREPKAEEAKMKIEEFKEKHPDLYNEVVALGRRVHRPDCGRSHRPDSGTGPCSRPGRGAILRRDGRQVPRRGGDRGDCRAVQGDPRRQPARPGHRNQPGRGGQATGDAQGDPKRWRACRGPAAPP